MPGTTFTSYSLTLGGTKGYFNPAGWNTTLTAVDATANDTVGAWRFEGANIYMYAMLGTNTLTTVGQGLKLSTALTDGGTSSFISPITLTQLGATAAGYFSCIAVNIQTMSALTYGWFLMRGIATLPLNSNTAGLAVGTPVAPSSSSACFADCAAASGIARVIDILGATSTAVQTGNGGLLCYINCIKTFI